MSKILIILILSITLYAGKPHALLDSISKYSIDIGKGKTNNVYIFVDPMCKHSKKLLKKIYTNKMLQLINTYHVFLYRLPKFESDKLIQYIYQSDDAKEILSDIVLKDKKIDLTSIDNDAKSFQKIKDISDTAKEFMMKKRPYIMVFDSNTGFCRVSEGDATCMEKYAFE